MISNIEADLWHKHPEPDEWSIAQILTHLVEAENISERPRLERILAEENPFITSSMPPGPYIPVFADDGYVIAQQFKETRHKTLDLIATLSAEDWRRAANHNIFGLTSLIEMAYFTAQHDRLHLRQLCETIGRCQD